MVSSHPPSKCNPTRDASSFWNCPPWVEPLVVIDDLTWAFSQNADDAVHSMDGAAGDVLEFWMKPVNVLEVDDDAEEGEFRIRR